MTIRCTHMILKISYTNMYLYHSVGTQTNIQCTHVKELIAVCYPLDTNWLGPYDFRTVAPDMNGAI